MLPKHWRTLSPTFMCSWVHAHKFIYEIIIINESPKNVGLHLYNKWDKFPQLSKVHKEYVLSFPPSIANESRAFRQNQRNRGTGRESYMKYEKVQAQFKASKWYGQTNAIQM